MMRPELKEGDLKECFCPPDDCQAPIIMGMQTRCIRRRQHEQPNAKQPVAWLHNQPGRYEVIHDEVKSLWLKVCPDMTEHYTIPLYRD